MKHESNSRRLFGITRSKGKMYELGLPEEMHFSLSKDINPEELFLLTIGTLGDVAAKLSEIENIDEPLSPQIMDELNFSASFFDAFIGSKFSKELDRDTAILAASAYYLARRPGSSLVLARKITKIVNESPVDKLLSCTLLSQWANFLDDTHPLFGKRLGAVAILMESYFQNGQGANNLNFSLSSLRDLSYRYASPRDLLFIDIIIAIIRKRLAASVWTKLPEFTGITSDRWANTIRRHEFPKELWPAQIQIGKAGIFNGASGVIQMPTSAGKTRSVEIILRSSFLSGRSKLAVIVVPFKALCHEIGTSLRNSFKDEDVNINELSDALQNDFINVFAEFFSSEIYTVKNILVLTPEKFIYILRQSSDIVNDIGIVIYDEGDQFDSGSRGIIYELLLAEIKTLLPEKAQTVFISAVIQNPLAIGKWLIGDSVQVVNGSGLLPTKRAVAFASWLEQLGQLMFFESDSYTERDYFVPRVIEEQKLNRLGKERADYFFPDKNKSNDIALYLGIRLVSQGAVAIFCGRKDTASGMASRVVEIYKRDFKNPPPSTWADQNEIYRMKKLFDGNFGSKSDISLSASFGIFVHHSTTPQGIRLSIEYAMQQSRINFVVCTSTLAQGVNLPIRYLIVSGIYQGREKLKVRDFQNLVGRAGRSGMHTEGLIIFSDPTVYDNREKQKESWKFNSSVELLKPGQVENTTSSLLELLATIQSSDGKGEMKLSANELCDLLFSDDRKLQQWAFKLIEENPKYKLNAKTLIAEIRHRRHLIFSLESYLMANRGTDSIDEFKLSAEKLAMSTLAYHLASDDLRIELKALFISVAEYIQLQEPSPQKQAVYSKTLLGVRNAKVVEHWVISNREILLTLDSNEKWLKHIWELFSMLSNSNFFLSIEPKSLAFQISNMWLQGIPYKSLFAHSKVEKGTKPWGEEKRRKLTEDDILKFCDSVLGFECTLIVAAVAQFLLVETQITDENVEALDLFQKALNYGLPDLLSISCYEIGFADRIVAQLLSDLVRANGYSGSYFAPALESHQENIEAMLKDYPSYFESVLKSRV